MLEIFLASPPTLPERLMMLASPASNQNTVAMCEVKKERPKPFLDTWQLAWGEMRKARKK
jgi:hypothetical protein